MKEHTLKSSHNPHNGIIRNDKLNNRSIIQKDQVLHDAAELIQVGERFALLGLAHERRQLENVQLIGAHDKLGEGIATLWLVVDGEGGEWSVDVAGEIRRIET